MHRFCEDCGEVIEEGSSDVVCKPCRAQREHISDLKYESYGSLYIPCKKCGYLVHYTELMDGCLCEECSDKLNSMEVLANEDI